MKRVYKTFCLFFFLVASRVFSKMLRHYIILSLQLQSNMAKVHFFQYTAVCMLPLGEICFLLLLVLPLTCNG